MSDYEQVCDECLVILDATRGRTLRYPHRGECEHCGCRRKKLYAPIEVKK